MNKLHVYIDENSKEQALRYMPHLIDINAAVFFIGENYDSNQLKIELNYVVSKGYDLYCVIFGNPVFDSGISMQMGLAKIVADNEYAPGELENFLSAKLEKKPRKFIIAIVAAAILVIAGIILAIPKDKPEPVKVDNIKLDDIYLQAFIEAGADCIVVDGGISQGEILTLQSLDLSGKGIEDLSPLLYATNLKELNLSNNNISDITALAALANLESIDLSNNPIANYAILDYLPKLSVIVK